jgi:hypothetical protein
MSQSNTVESWLQFQLRVLTQDELSPSYFSTGFIDGIPDRTPQRWQLAVDMMYRCIVSGLVGVVTPRYRNDHDAFFHAIRILNPYDERGINLWYGVDLFSTDALVELIGKYFPETGQYDGTVNPVFIQELKDIFAEHNVPWSDAPLLPIVTNDHSASA